MKKVILILILCFSFMTPSQKAHAMDAKSKAFMVICTYGTVGGALLGFATMAFGTNSRAIAQGASLGLYAGIAFGSYVIMSHKKSLEPIPEEEYNDAPPPGFDGGAGGGFGGAPPEEESSGGFFGTSQRYIELNDDLVYNYRLKNKKGRGFSPPVYLNLVKIIF